LDFGNHTFENYELGDPQKPIFSCRLQPHRSLTKHNFHILLSVFGVASLVSSLPFIWLGAWPVAGFMGLDAALLYYAFRVNFKAARAYEDVRLSPFELFLAKVNASGQRAEWRFNPLWVRFEREEHEEFGTQRLAFVSRGHRIEVAQFLGPEEKAIFAGNFSLALSEAKRGPRYS
jgi:uncharacterized membrane protein